MRSIATISLEPEMELAEDVMSLKNELLYPANTRLDQNMIDKLKRYQIMCVSIKEAEDYATTHYEKITLSRSFKEFENEYKTQLLAYKYLITDFFENETAINTSLLMEIYNKTYRAAGRDDDMLLDMLYKMMPTDDNMTYAHCFNGALIAGAFASWLQFDEKDKEIMILSGFLYDIGKLKLPNKLIWKVGKLNDFEYNWMKTHTTIGYDLLKTQELNIHIINAALMHHERDNGTGYPNKLMGNAIDRFAKYMAIVDSYEAMTSSRTYRDSLNPFQVIANFERGGLYQYDLAAVTTILTHIAARQVGHTVILNHDENSRAVIRMVNPNKLSRPFIETPSGILDMNDYPKMEITSIL